MRGATTFADNLLPWGAAHRRSFPWRQETERFRLLVAEVLLQRSRASSVARVYGALFERWPDALALASADPAQIERTIRPLGLVRRADSLKRLAEELVRIGTVPTTAEELLRLPGVGRYAALAVSTEGGKPVVDTVSARVYRRFFGLDADRQAVVDDKLWRLVEEVTPAGAARALNWAVLDLAATVCLPRRPRCPGCPLAASCHSADQVAVS